MPIIISITAKKILDSKGRPTVEAAVILDGGISASASVPAGVSAGKHEAVVIPAEQAVKNISEIIAPALLNCDPSDQETVDRKLIELDGTENKSRLGANAILAVSATAARAAAKAAGRPLWRHLRLASGLRVPEGKRLRLFVNVIEGGLHAGSGLPAHQNASGVGPPDKWFSRGHSVQGFALQTPEKAPAPSMSSGGTSPFQEYLAISKAENYVSQIKKSRELYNVLGEILRNKYGAVTIGDEGGFSPPMKSPTEPFTAIKEAAEEAGLPDNFDLGMDAAGSNVKMSAEELMALYLSFGNDYGLVFIEDPFGEEDFGKFAELKARMPGAVICGDDLTTTNIGRMARAAEEKSVNGVIIKPNQIGTFSEAFAAVRFAREYGWSVVASHRGGETNDDWIADFAHAVGADGFKLGSPSRPERIAKYERLLAIEKESVNL